MLGTFVGKITVFLFTSTYHLTFGPIERKLTLRVTVILKMSDFAGLMKTKIIPALLLHELLLNSR